MSTRKKTNLQGSDDGKLTPKCQKGSSLVARLLDKFDSDTNRQ